MEKVSWDWGVMGWKMVVCWLLFVVGWFVESVFAYHGGLFGFGFDSEVFASLIAIFPSVSA